MDMKENLVIQAFPRLEKLVVKNKAFMYSNLLKISGLDKLKTIEIEDGGWGTPFEFVKHVVIESTYCFVLL